MAETTEENIEELNKIAQNRYGNYYHDLCTDKQRIIRSLYASGFPNL